MDSLPKQWKISLKRTDYFDTLYNEAKMKYTIKELIDKDINIYCPTKEKYNRLVEYLESQGVEDILIPFDDFHDKEETCISLYKSLLSNNIQTHWRSVKKVNSYITTEQFFGDNFEPLCSYVSDCSDAFRYSLGYAPVAAPSVINEATAAFDRFLKEWNALHKKATKIKSIKSLDKLTDKIKEL